MRRGLAWGSVIAVLLAVTAPSAVAGSFRPSTRHQVELVSGEPGAGVLRVSSEGVIERIQAGRSEPVLSVNLEVDNRSGRPLSLRTIDLWVVTEGGTLLSQPDLRQDGLAVSEAVVADGERSSLTALFHLGAAGAFRSFTLHWGGHLDRDISTGQVDFLADGEGYPGGGEEIAVDGSEDVEAGSDTPGEDEEYGDEEYHAHSGRHESYPGHRYRSFSISLGYFPFYGHYQYGHHAYGYFPYPHYGYGYGYGGYRYGGYAHYGFGYSGSRFSGSISHHHPHGSNHSHLRHSPHHGRPGQIHGHHGHPSHGISHGSRSGHHSRISHSRLSSRSGRGGSLRGARGGRR